LGIPAHRIAVVPLGVNLKGFDDVRAARRTTDAAGPFRVGYFARVAPEKGLHVLARAFVRLRTLVGDAPLRLEAAGYLASAHETYLGDVRRLLADAKLLDSFRYRGSVDRDGKVAFMGDIDVLSVPATFDDSKGLPLLEAMAAGVPVVQPSRGSFAEIVRKTGGGVLVRPGDEEALAQALYSLWRDRTLARDLGRRGAEGVRAHYTIQHSVDKLLAVYGDTITGREVPVRPEGRVYVH
jgi:glycosyltransferase involved in cell wall biosynthesis